MKKEEAHESNCACKADPREPDLLIDALSGALGGEMKARLGQLIATTGLWATAIDLALHHDPRVAFRAAWALEWAYENNRQALRPYTGRFIDNFARAVNSSVHRHYAKIICDMLRRGILVPSPAQAEQIAEKAFDLLIDPATKTAVKAWCMDTLFHLCRIARVIPIELDWIEEQLREILHLMMQEEPSKGIAARARKLLTRMK